MAKLEVIAEAADGTTAPDGNEVRDAKVIGGRVYRFYEAITTAPILFNGTAWRAVLAYLSETDPAETSPISDTPLATYTETSGGASRLVSVYPHSDTIMAQVPGYVGGAALTLNRTAYGAVQAAWEEEPDAFEAVELSLIDTAAPTTFAFTIRPKAGYATPPPMHEVYIVHKLTSPTAALPYVAFPGLNQHTQIGPRAGYVLRDVGDHVIVTTVTWYESGIPKYWQRTRTVTVTEATYDATFTLGAVDDAGNRQYTDPDAMFEAVEGLNAATFPRVKVEIERGATYNITTGRRQTVSDQKRFVMPALTRLRLEAVGTGTDPILSFPQVRTDAENATNGDALPTAVTSWYVFEFENVTGTISAEGIKFRGPYDPLNPDLADCGTIPFGFDVDGPTADIQVIFADCDLSGFFHNIDFLRNPNNAEIVAVYDRCTSDEGHYNFWHFGNASTVEIFLGCQLYNPAGGPKNYGRTLSTRYNFPEVVHATIRNQEARFVVVHGCDIDPGDYGWDTAQALRFFQGGDNIAIKDTTSVTDEGGLARFNYSASGVSDGVVGRRLVVRSGTYEGDYEITAAGSGYIVADVSFVGDSAGVEIAWMDEDVGTFPAGELSITQSVIRSGFQGIKIDCQTDTTALRPSVDAYLDNVTMVSRGLSRYAITTNYAAIIRNLEFITPALDASEDFFTGIVVNPLQDILFFGDGTPAGPSGSGTVYISGLTVNARTEPSGTLQAFADPLGNAPNLFATVTGALLLGPGDSRVNYTDVSGRLTPIAGSAAHQNGTASRSNIGDINGRLRASPPSLGAREPVV